MSRSDDLVVPLDRSEAEGFRYVLFLAEEQAPMPYQVNTRG